MATKKQKNDDTGVSSSPKPPPTTTDIYPLNNIIIGKKNQYVITEKDVITDQEKKEPKRSPNSFYISENISKGWRRYCELSGHKTHLLTESAFIEYMQRHPLSQVTLNITQDLTAYAPDVKTRLRNKILRDKIGSVIATLHRIQETGRGDADSFRQQLQKLVLQATKLKHLDADLVDLLKEAERWL
jgi:hypothetical protein